MSQKYFGDHLKNCHSDEMRGDNTSGDLRTFWMNKCVMKCYALHVNTAVVKLGINAVIIWRKINLYKVRAVIVKTNCHIFKFMAI